MDKIFSVTRNTYLTNSDFSIVNNFLEENPTYSVKSVTPVGQYGNNQFGVVITVSNKE